MPTWSKEFIELSKPLIDPLLVRTYCRVVTEDEDDFLLWLVHGAAITVETDSRFTVRPVAYSATLAANTRPVQLPAGPFHSATLIRVDSEGNETPVEDEILHDDGYPGCLTLPKIEESHSSLKLSYQAGTHPIRPDVEVLVLSLVAHRYEHREAATGDGVVKTVPLGYHHSIRGLDPLTDGVN